MAGTPCSERPHARMRGRERALLSVRSRSGVRGPPYAPENSLSRTEPPLARTERNSVTPLPLQWLPRTDSAQPARGREFPSQLLVWCFTIYGTWELVPEAGALTLRLVPPAAGVVWSTYPALDFRSSGAGPDCSKYLHGPGSPNPPWLVSWGVSKAWQDPP